MAADHGDRATVPGEGDVDAYLSSVGSDRRRGDAQRALALMREVTGAPPRMWGTTMVGFGRQPYRTADGKDREWFAVGLAPRKAALTLYGLTYDRSNDDLLARLGPHTTGKGCLYITRLDDLDEGVLRDLVARAWSTNHEAAE